MQTFPRIELPAPVLALTAAPDGGVWAGGLGGVARLLPDLQTWQSCIAGLPLTHVAALEYTGGWLFAGGSLGLARSHNGGQSWQQVTGGAPNIAAIAASPQFEHDQTVLAASLSHGILRSEDAGQSWAIANFGLQDFSVSALCWVDSQVVLCGSSKGIYRSPNTGRAWKVAAGCPEESVAAIMHIENGLLAALENGAFYFSDDSGVSWSQVQHDLPDDIQPAALCLLPDDTLLLGSSNAGIWHGDSQGQQWQSIADGVVFALAMGAEGDYAGTAQGVLYRGAEDHNFTPLPLAPLHDVRQLATIGETVFAYGQYSGLLRYADGWQLLTDAPLPISAVTTAPDDSLWVAGKDRIVCSRTGGDSWETRLPNSPGGITQITFRDSQLIWACSREHLLRSDDRGENWQISPSPFGILSVIALTATPDLLLAVTYDNMRQIARLWRSEDDGSHWTGGVEVRSPWPIATSHTNPPIITLGSVILVQQGAEWKQAKAPENALVRRITGDESRLIALTATTGLIQSVDAGLTWEPYPMLNMDPLQIMDIARADGKLFLLESGGQVMYDNL